MLLSNIQHQSSNRMAIGPESSIFNQTILPINNGSRATCVGRLGAKRYGRWLLNSLSLRSLALSLFLSLYLSHSATPFHYGALTLLFCVFYLNIHSLLPCFLGHTHTHALTPLFHIACLSMYGWMMEDR